MLVFNKKFKIGPFLLANLVLIQSAFPYQSFALTGGPSQPEVQSFEPIGTNQMVDLFTGDFNYNIPLLNVPGPNGGYPINIAYHAGAGMEEEASWVGLGWNLNPGVLSRSLRGLPDDFKGSIVKKTRYTKPNKTYAIGGNIGLSGEIAILGDKGKGTVGLGASLGIRYNNYRGFDYSTGLNATAQAFGSPTVGLGVTHDTQTGTGITPSISFGKNFDKISKNFGLSMSKTLHSRQGALPTNFGLSVNSTGHFVGSFSTNISVNPYSTFMPASAFGTKENSLKVATEFGVAAFGLTGKLDIWASYSESKIKNENQSLKSYGYLYSEYADDESLMDFNREKDGAIHHDSPRLPMPIYTNDIFNASGNGIGGSFKAMRTDVAHLGDPEVVSKSTGEDFSYETGIGPGSHIGADVNLTYNKIVQGKWVDKNDDLKSKGYAFKDEDYKKANPHFKPFYFKNLSEMSASRVTDESASKALSVNSSAKSKKVSLLNLPDPDDFKVTSTITANGTLAEKYLHRDEYIGDAMSFKTVSELKAASEYTGYHSYLYPTEGTTKWSEGTLPLDRHGNLIGEVSVLNSSGMKYVYGLPAINHKTHTFAFAIDKVSGDARFNKTVAYNRNESTGDRRTRNDNGIDEFYEHIETPAYAHSFHLTSIFTPDYVDLTGDGPTPDDFGSYILFDYELAEENYKWRAPYTDANLSIGFLDSESVGRHDDKANFTYGEKQIYYLSSIKTKTHQASFITDDRSDARGVSSIDQYSLSSKEGHMKRLDKINLNVLNDDGTLGQHIKSVHFKYSYDLCKGIENGDVTNQGKLTLDNIWFSKYGNHGGVLNRYEFEYYKGDNTDTDNELNDNYYNPHKIDRWGNYASTMTEKDYNLAPYVNQDEGELPKNIRDRDASLWNLKKIGLPSGADINIQYESDTYSSVQDKKAMMMYDLLGVAEKDGGNFELSNGNMSKSKYLVVKPTSQFELSDIGELTSNITDVYFKAFVNLKGSYKDFVEGYGKIDPNTPVEFKTVTDDGVTINGGNKCLLIKLKPTALGKYKVHPIRGAAIRYIKNERSDLIPTPFSGGFNPIDVIGMFTGIINSIKGPYKTALDQGEAKRFATEQNSYVRLNTIGKKYGGGHRVKQVTLSDNWDSMSGVSGSGMEYGQTYTYENESNESSFGVCSYEPFVGDEENPFRKPLYFKGDSYIVDDEARFVEDVYGEQFQPGPSVGYSKVIVENITRNEEHVGGDKANERMTLKSGAGIQVNEFYTTKDYPVVIQHSNSSNKSSDVNARVSFPFIGSFSTQYAGYSQSYKVILNNMPGKVKKQSTYKSTQDVLDPTVLPLTFTKYEYQDKVIQHCDGTYKRVLDPRAKVMGEKGVITWKHLGESKELYTDSRNNKSRNYVIGTAGNFDIPFNPFPFGVPNFQVQFNMNVSGYSSLVTNEVINRRGILSKTIQYDSGKRVVTENQVYDGYSGSPILTAVNNDQYRKQYALSMLAHQQYPDMGSAYNNLGREIYVNGSQISGGGSVWDVTYSLPAQSKVFKPGDMIAIYNHTDEAHLGYAIAYDWTESMVRLKSYDGSSLASIDNNKEYSFKIIESANTNQLSASIGSAMSLNKDIAGLMFGQHDILTWINSLHPLNEHKHPELERWLVLPKKVFNEDNSCDEYKLSGGTYIDYSSGDPFIHLGTLELSLLDANDDEIPSIFDGQLLPCLKPGAYYYFEGLDKINCSQKGDNGAVEEFTWMESSGLKAQIYEDFPVCYDILDAQSMTYSDQWEYPNYLFPSEALTGNVVANEDAYRYGTKGTWRPKSSYTKLTERIQTNLAAPTEEPDLSESGIYEDFRPFNWQDLNDNGVWTKTSEMTKYSPFGDALESKNALEQYTSELKGYNNTVTIATAQNARHDEIGYASFEDATGSLAGQVLGNFEFFGFLSVDEPFTGGHTGDHVMRINPGANNIHLKGNDFDPTKKYVYSFWVKGDYTCGSNCTDWSVDYIYHDGSNEQFTTFDIDQANITLPVEGWTKVELVVQIPSGTINNSSPYHGMRLSFDNASTFNTIDDLRFHPYNSYLSTYVYDIEDYKTLAELDNQNFATFYEYDINRNLYQVKKETVRGIKTLQTVRQNLPNKE